jgi:hypothetical protein
MKKILITGMNNVQTQKDGYLNQQLKVVHAHYSLFRCLEDMGWEVEQRPVLLGEDLSKYDEVILWVHSPKGFAQRLYSGLYTAAVRPDCIMAMDDWQMNQIMLSVTNFHRHIDNVTSHTYRDYFLSVYKGPESLEEIKLYHSQYKIGLENILARKSRFLVAAFKGGDISLLNNGWKTNRIFTFNPNPYHLNRAPWNNFGENTVTQFTQDSNISKKREWIFASLMQAKTQKWLKTHKVTWPIEYYGSKRGELKSMRLTEDLMCKAYSESWGCLVPSYYHAGSGFWRPRALQLADAGSIMIVDDEEGKVYSDAHCGFTTTAIEHLSDLELIKLAKFQKEGIYDNHPLDKNVTKRELQEIFDAEK